MKKQDALTYIRNIRGFVPYHTFFDIWNDDDEIPQELVDISCRPEIKNNFILCGAHLASALNESFKNVPGYGKSE